jgi:hypothetical protein
MSEGIEEQYPDGGGSNPDPEQLTYQQENPQHEASNKQGKGSIEDQLLNAIGMDNTKKDQKATNPLLKHKENKPENTKLGTKTAQSKVTKSANRQQQKMNSTLLTLASAEGWFETTNIKESLITNEEDKDENGNASNVNYMTMDTDNQILMQNQHPPPPKGQFRADSEAILANILINTIASNRKLEILQEEVQKVQEQNANLTIGLQQAYGLIKELRRDSTSKEKQQISQTETPRT